MPKTRVKLSLRLAPPRVLNTVLRLPPAVMLVHVILQRATINVNVIKSNLV